MIFLLSALVLSSTLPLTYGDGTSAGHCGTRSVFTVPGCFGVPACVYRIATDFPAENLCKYNYCDCGGTPVPLLPQTVSGTTTVGCDSYTVQPTEGKCPSTPATVPTSTQLGDSTTIITLASGPSTTGLTTITTRESTLPASTTQTETITSTAPSLQPSTTRIITHVTTETPTRTSLASTVVILGSTIPIPASSSTTITKSHTTLIIGPSGIVQSGDTIPIPSLQTTITSDGLTLTFNGKTSSPAPVQSASASETNADSASSATGSPAITAPPSGSSGFIPTAIPPSGSIQPQVALTFNSESFVLPHTVSVELLQSDGSFVTLFPSSIVSGSATVIVSNPSSPTTLTLGDLSIEAGPQPKGTPHTGGASGLSGLINALGSLASDANAIVNTLDQIGQKGVLWSAGSINTATFGGDVGTLLNGVTSDLSNFISAVGSTIDNFDGEIYEMTEGAQGRVFSAYEGAKEDFDILNSLKQLLRNIPSLRNNALNLAQNYWTKGAAAAAILAAAEAALRSFGSYDWASEIRNHAATSSLSSNNAQSTMNSTSPTTSSSGPSPTPTLYMIRTKRGTDAATFKEYIKTLPDKGSGGLIVFPFSPWQCYQTTLTTAEAALVRKESFVETCYLIEPVETFDYGTIPPNHQLDKRINLNLHLQERLNSDPQLRVISQEPGAALHNYLFDPKLGEGQTIYILDSGFNLDHQELAPGIREVRHDFVPNEYTLAPIESDTTLWAPEGITDYNGHGTKVASVAGGKTHGVASDADLFLLKFRGFTKNPLPGGSGRWFVKPATPGGIEWAFLRVMSDVLDQRSRGNTGKFILNLSSGFNPQHAGITQQFVLNYLQDLWSLDVVTVVAAGNEGNAGGTLSINVPQNLGTAINGLITVGGVNSMGELDRQTTFDDGTGGSITVYALSQDVICADYLTNDGSVTASGTSLAAPAVAGLAAYFASLSSLDNQWQSRSVSTDMKNYIARHAYQRTDDPLGGLVPGILLPPPNSIIVAYNKAPEGLCSAHLPSDVGSGAAQGAELMRRQNSSQDIDVVVSGTIVVSSLSQSYCSNTSAPTSHLASTSATSSAFTAATSTVSTTATINAPPTPTVNIDDGILTCGIRTDPGNPKFWFTLEDAEAAINQFCGSLTKSASGIVFSSTGATYVNGTDTPPDNPAGTISTSVKWNTVGGSDCPAWNATVNDNAFQLCKDRFGIPVQNCDTKKNGHNFWKQGGEFYRDCLTWQITSN